MVDKSTKLATVMRHRGKVEAISRWEVPVA